MLRKSKFCWFWTKQPATLHEALTQYFCTVDSSTKHLVVRQESKRNALVPFRSDTEHSCTVDSSTKHLVVRQESKRNALVPFRSDTEHSCTADSSTKHLVVQQESKRNALVPFHSDTEHSCTAKSYTLVNNSTKGIYSPVSMRFFRAFSSVVRQMPRYNSHRRGTARTSQCTSQLFFSSIVMCAPSSVFCVLFVCKCVLYNCHRVSTQLQSNNNNNNGYANASHCYVIRTSVLFTDAAKCVESLQDRA
jgi:ribosomal 30S subunit maturation factor RimM